jgi:hypothetical protein
MYVPFISNPVQLVRTQASQGKVIPDATITQADLGTHHFLE